MTIAAPTTRIYTPATIPPSLIPPLFDMLNTSFGIAAPFSTPRLDTASEILTLPDFYGGTIKNWWIAHQHPSDAPLSTLATMTLRQNTEGVYSVHLVAVAQECMGLGLGRKLCGGWVEEFVGRRGGGVVKVETLRDYGCGAGFYEKCGWTVTREEKLEAGVFGSHMPFWLVHLERVVEAQEGKWEEVEGGKEGWVWGFDGRLVKVEA